MLQGNQLVVIARRHDDGVAFLDEPQRDGSPYSGACPGDPYQSMFWAGGKSSRHLVLTSIGTVASPAKPVFYPGTSRRDGDAAQFSAPAH
jgi:hypothetical protein